MSMKQDTSDETTKLLSEEEESELLDIYFTIDNFVATPKLLERMQYLEMKKWNL